MRRYDQAAREAVIAANRKEASMKVGVISSLPLTQLQVTILKEKGASYTLVHAQTYIEVTYAVHARGRKCTCVAANLSVGMQSAPQTIADGTRDMSKGCTSARLGAPNPSVSQCH